MSIKNVLVVGMGMMGHGIAPCCAQAGFKTHVYDIHAEFLNQGVGWIEKNLQKRLRKEKVLPSV